MNETNTTKNYKSGIIFLLAIACFFILLKSLPFAPKENAGLALLAFVAILWLTEA
ncbi:MAG: SLC13/DASS family transporter, partial [Haemophilus parainfluenzae]